MVLWVPLLQLRGEVHNATYAACDYMQQNSVMSMKARASNRPRVQFSNADDKDDTSGTQECTCGRCCRCMCARLSDDEALLRPFVGVLYRCV